MRRGGHVRFAGVIDGKCGEEHSSREEEEDGVGEGRLKIGVGLRRRLVGGRVEAHLEAAREGEGR